MQKLPLVLITLGFTILILGVVLGWVVAPEVIKKQVEKQVQLKNGTETFEKWQDIPIPVYLMFYIFNVTNPAQVERGARPVLKEVGPYVYREKRVKVDLAFSEDEEFVSYRQKIDYFFEAEMSEGAESDLVNIINIPFVAVASKISELHFTLKYFASMYLESFDETLFIRKTVSELLFQGYEQKLMQSLEKLTGQKILHNNKFGLYYPTVAMMIYPLSPNLANTVINLLRLFSLGSESMVRRKVRVGDLTFNGFPVPFYDIPFQIISNLAPTLNITVPELPPEFEGGRFGAYRGKNGSDDGLWQVHTGVQDRNKFGAVYKWENQTKLNWWVESPGDYCNMLNGSDGSVFPPFVKQDTVLRLFNPDICRSLYLTYEQKTEFRGIPALRFVAPRAMLEDPNINKDNLCFCTNPGENNEGCLKSGAIQLSSCRDGAPVAMSTPHFFESELEYVDQSFGLRPNKDRHATYIDIEPLSGLPLRAHKRIQINVELKKMSGVAAFENVPQMLFPVLWADEFAEIDEENANEVKSRLLTPLKIVNAGKWAILGLSFLILSAGGAIFLFRLRQKKYYA